MTTAARALAGAVTFVVDGQPASQPRPRVTVTRTGKRRTYYATPKTDRQMGYVDYKQYVAGRLLETLGGKPTPDDGPYRVDVDFYCIGQGRKDLDKMLGAIYDGLAGLVYVDDKQVVDGRVRKFRQSTQPRAVITITPLTAWPVDMVADTPRRTRGGRR